MILISFIFVSIFLLNLLYRKYIRYRKWVDRIPGPKIDSYFWGNLKIFIKPNHISRIDHLKTFYQSFWELFKKFRHEGVFRLWFGPLHVIYILTNAESVERLLTSTKNLNKGIEYKLLHPWLGDGLLLADSNIWKPHRKIITPAFHFKVLHNFIPIFSTHTEKLLKFVDSNMDKINQKSVINDVASMFENLTLDIIKETAMGIDPNEDTGIDNETYRNAVKRTFNGAVNRVRNPLHWFDLIYSFTKTGKNFYKHLKILNDYSRKIIPRQIKNFYSKIDENEIFYDENLPKSTILIDILIENYYRSNKSVPIGTKMLQSEVNTFILGGHETTAMTLTYALLMVGCCADVQDKIHDELRSIFQENVTTTHKAICIDDLRQMRYLEMCIKETLRLYPVATIIGRNLTDALELPNGVTLPASATCYVPFMYLHKDPKYFPEPEKFNPERFSPSNSSQISNPFAYVPFSAGPRNCVGQKYAMLELKFVLAEILRRFRVISLTKPEDVLMQIGIILKPVTKIEITFEKIDNF